MDVVDTTSMNINLFTKGSHGHSGTLNVPTWKSFAPAAVPAKQALLPDGKVSWMVLLSIYFHAGTAANLF